MNVYRQHIARPIEVRGEWRSWRSRIRRWWRVQAIECGGGVFRSRFPAKCPTCARRSWDPHRERQRDHGLESTDVAMRKMNSYRCGHNGDLRGRMVMM